MTAGKSSALFKITNLKTCQRNTKNKWLRRHGRLLRACLPVTYSFAKGEIYISPAVSEMQCSATLGNQSTMLSFSEGELYADRGSKRHKLPFQGRVN